MFIATCAVGYVKLRRSGMNGAGDYNQADPDPPGSLAVASP
jgi:hypothetical protein